MSATMPQPASGSLIGPTPFFLMSSHGEAVRLPLVGGTVILSSLPSGRSRIRADAPSLKYVLEGEATYEIEGRSRRLRSGEFMLVDSGVEVEARTSRSDDTVGLCVYLGASAAPAPGATLACGRAIAGNRNDPLAALLGHYARLLAGRPGDGPALARRIVREATVGAENHLAAFGARLERLTSVKQSTRIETLQRIERARAFIHAGADHALTLEQVAAHAALSRFHLTRSFTQVFGLPPLAYHRRLRLEAAARLLKNDAMTPSQLAEQLGYASLSAFTRAFRQNFGVPPSRAKQVN